MENAVEALHMAGSVLIFVLALTLAISSYSNVLAQADRIFTSEERVDYAYMTDEDGNISYLNYIMNSSDIRTVGAETLISSIRRVANENYRIYILANEIDWEDLGLEISSAIEQRYNDTVLISAGSDIVEISLSGNNRNVSQILTQEFYNAIKDKKFKEYLGIYQNNSENVAEVNRTTYRIITYVEE